MKVLSLIILACFGHSIMSAQNGLPKYPYEPLTFEDFEPVWYETYVDSTVMGSDSTDGYNYMRLPMHKSDLIDGEYLYAMVHGRSFRSIFTRTQIHKRNLSTGEIMWSINYGLGIDEGKMETGRIMEIDDNGNLQILGLLCPLSYQDGLTNLMDGSFNLLMTQRTYNTETGELLSYDVPDLDDKDLALANYSLGTRNEEIYVVGDSLQMFRNLRNVNRTHYEVSTRTYNSKKNDIFIDTFISPFTYWTKPNYSAFNPMQIDDQTYLYIGSQGSRISFHYINDKGKDIDIIIGDSIAVNAKSGLLHKISQNMDKFLISVVVDIPNTTDTRSDFLVINQQGKIEHRVELPFGYAGKHVLDWDEQNNRLTVLGSKWYQDEQYIALDLLYFDPEGIMSVVNSYRYDGLRYINNITSYKVNEEYYLLKIREGNIEIVGDYIQADNLASAVSHMLVRASDFDVSSVNTIDIKNDISLNIHPNPSVNIININTESLPPGFIRIYDMMGNIVFLRDIETNNMQQSINIQSLKSGTYLIKIYTNEGIESAQTKFIKI